jgi:hypothetical protein
MRQKLSHHWCELLTHLSEENERLQLLPSQHVILQLVLLGESAIEQLVQVVEEVASP